MKVLQGFHCLTRNTLLSIASYPTNWYILECCNKSIETCLGDEPSPMLLDLYRKISKLIEGNEKIECISKVCMYVTPFFGHTSSMAQVFPYKIWHLLRRRMFSSRLGLRTWVQHWRKCTYTCCCVIGSFPGKGTLEVTRRGAHTGRIGILPFVHLLSAHWQVFLIVTLCLLVDCDDYYLVKNSCVYIIMWRHEGCSQLIEETDYKGFGFGRKNQKGRQMYSNVSLCVATTTTTTTTTPCVRGDKRESQTVCAQPPMVTLPILVPIPTSVMTGHNNSVPRY